MRRLSVLSLFICLLAAPAAASAATTVESSGNTVFVDGDAGPNSITISKQDEYVVVAAGATVTDANDSDDCEQDGDRVRCTTLGALQIVRVRGNDGNDTLTAETDVLLVLLHGLAGNDTLYGSGDGEQTELSGGDGNDSLHARAGWLDARDSGGAGDDLLNGGVAGVDVFQQEPGADTYIGGTATPLVPAECPDGCGDGDRIEYVNGPVTVTLDGMPGDGAAGEGDNVHPDVEALVGTPQDDVVDAAGAGRPVAIEGRGGADALTGGPGSDRLDGGAGADTLTGAAGDDHLSAGDDDSDPPTPDRLDGGEGDDTLEPGGYADDIVGGAGIDTATFHRSTGDGTTRDFEITLDDQANDGERGRPEGDNVHSDVEVIRTWGGNDRVVGSAAPEQIDTGSGNDEIDGRGGVDLITAGSGVDTILSRDLGYDLVNCGLGIDATVQGDAGDRLENCEASTLTPLPPPPDTTRPQVVLGGATRISARAFRKARGVILTARTNETSSLLGEAVVRGMIARAGDLVIGQRSLPLASAGTRRFKIRIPRRDVRAIRRKLRKRAFRLTVRVTATDAAGNRTAASRRITIRKR